jgi:hypothetical protein
MDSSKSLAQLHREDQARLSASLTAAVRAELQEHLRIAREAELESRRNILTAITDLLERRIRPIEQDVAELKRAVAQLQKRVK